MSALTNLYIDDAYPGLLHANAAELPTTGQQDIYDGNGNISSLKLGRACNGATICGGLTVDTININGTNWFDLIYPVGSILVTTQNTVSPALQLLGTWQQVAQGRFIAGVGSDLDANGNPGAIVPGKIGNIGEYDHQLTVGELPAHTHTLPNVLSWPGTLVEQMYSGVAPLNYSDVSGGTGPTGSGQYHNNMPPAFGLYLFERTA